MRLPALLLSAACLGNLSHASTPTRPNILVVVADDWSFPHAGAYGTKWVHTPGFDRIAREGTLFAQAYTPVAKCSPSRACLITGRNPWQLDAGFQQRSYFPVKYVTYAEALEAHGYFTGYTGKGWGPGEAINATGGRRALLGRNFAQRTTQPPATGINRNDYAANFADFLAAAPAGQPWCFWLGANEPHRPYEYGSGTARGGKRLADIDRLPAYLPDEERIRQDYLDYAFEVEYFDLQLRRALEQLSTRGDLANTLVIVTSDNGMPFPRAKAESYELSNHVPLAIRWPDKTPKPGRLVRDYVSLIDIAPTILEAAGLDIAQTGMSPSPGRSLLPLLASDKVGHVDPTRDHVLIGRERNAPGRPLDQGYPTRGVVKDGWLFLFNAAPDRWPAGPSETVFRELDRGPTFDVLLERQVSAGHDRIWDLIFAKRGAFELYDLQTDPDCVSNLAGNPEHSRQLTAMRGLLTHALVLQEDPREKGDPDYFDRFPSAYAPYNGYYEAWQRDQAEKAKPKLSNPE